MEFLRPAPTRFLAASAASVIAVVGLAGVCAAQDGSDGLTQAAYHGPFLTWAGKSAPPAAAPAPPAEYVSPLRAAPMPPPAPEALPVAAPSRPVANPAPPPSVMPTPVALRSTHLAPPAPMAYAPAPTPARVAAKGAAKDPPAQQLAQAAAAPRAAPPLPPTGVRFYSLHREYGMTPDPIAAPQDRPMVLIGPPDNPPQQSQDDAQDGQKAAHRGDGQGADD
jgi:hypothetical protein